jgi:hypothetical protein
MKKTAVEWLGEKILELGNSYELPEDDIDELIIKAKEMEKEQIGYSEEEVNEMFNTLKRNSIDNVATITNVDLFITSWKREFKNKQD